MFNFLSKSLSAKNHILNIIIEIQQKPPVPSTPSITPSHSSLLPPQCRKTLPSPPQCRSGSSQWSPSAPAPHHSPANISVQDPDHSQNQSDLKANDKSLHPLLSELQQGDACDDTKLAEEASEDNFFLPDLGQVPGLQQDLMRYWELEKEE